MSSWHVFHGYEVCLVVVRPGLLLKKLNDVLVQFEGPAEDISVDRRRCSKYRVRDGDSSRVLAAEGGKRQRRGVSKVELEVDQT